MELAKWWMGVAVAAGLSLGCVVAARAGTEVVGGVTWSYSLSLEGNATVTGADPAKGVLFIPSSLGNCPVTSIGRKTFSDCSGLTSVTIPGSVASILDEAFYGCNGLTSVTICNGVTSIGYSAFQNCSGLTSVTIPDSMTSIGNMTFSGCSGLTSVTIGNSVTNIGYWAFDGCSGLTSVTIPDSVTSILGAVFRDCRGLTNISVAAGNPQYSSANGMLLTKDGTTLLQGINGDVTIPDSVTSIEYEAFSGCSGLTSVTIPDSVTSIEGYAFFGCHGLTHVTIGNGVTSIGWGTFYGCSGLTSVTISDSVTNIGSSAFDGCSGLTSVTIPDSVTSIGGSAFYGCSGLTRVTIGNSVTNIGDEAFSWCRGLAHVTIPVGVTSIGWKAFSDCSGLTSVTIGNGVTNIGSYAFSGCSGLQKLRVPKAWEGTSMLDEVWGDYGKPEGCEIIYYEPGESGGAVPVPDEWIDKNAAEILAANGGDYEAAANAAAANRMRVWECYLAGLSPTDEAAEFKVKSIEFVDGKPVVTWEPDLNEGGARRARVYRVWARKSIEKEEPEGDGTRDGWKNVTGQETRWVEEGWRCFKVEVELPQEGATEQAAQTISFAVIGTQTPADRVELSATATGGGEVTFEVVSGPGVIAGNVLTFTGAGTVVVRAVQAGDERWLPAVATQTVTVIDAGKVLYMVVDLSAGSGEGAVYPVSYLGVVPEGGWTDEYKTTKLVLRRIEPGTFMMCGNYQTTLTKPYYMGVFEVTQKQWELVTGGKPSYFKNAACYQKRPVEKVSWNMIRGDSGTYDWPNSAEMDANSFMGRLRARTGLEFDLPTEAQWEYACRAGTTSSYNNGGNSEDDLKRLGRYYYNGGQNGYDSPSCDTSAGTAEVGSYLPNAWGLYDMHGNVYEWCLDWDWSLADGATDPVGSSSGSCRVHRGGGWCGRAHGCTSSYRNSSSPSFKNGSDLGFRLVRTLSK